MAEKKRVSNEWTDKFFNIHLAIIKVRAWETKEEAWRRHLKMSPQDLFARVRIFRRESKGTGSVL